jgi:hypothetical protein
MATPEYEHEVTTCPQNAKAQILAKENDRLQFDME